MMNMIDSQPEALLSRMSSLADATRLRLLHLLGRQELGVIDLCDILQMPQSTISRHLKILSDQGWVRSNSKGTNHLYRMPMDQLEAPARRLWLLAHDQIANWATIQQDQLRLARRLRRRQDRAQAFFAGAVGDCAANCTAMTLCARLRWRCFQGSTLWPTSAVALGKWRRNWPSSSASSSPWTILRRCCAPPANGSQVLPTSICGAAISRLCRSRIAPATQPCFCWR